MRTGAEYREALRDGRRVWMMGEGLVEDVTRHPATRAMVDAYAQWYDMHFDADWQAAAFAPPGAGGVRRPWAYTVPKSPDDLSGMGQFFAATTFLSAGNITHTPAYGNLISLGVLAAVEDHGAPASQIAAAAAYRERIAESGRF